MTTTLHAFRARRLIGASGEVGSASSSARQTLRIAWRVPGRNGRVWTSSGLDPEPECDAGQTDEGTEADGVAPAMILTHPRGHHRRQHTAGVAARVEQGRGAS